MVDHVAQTAKAERETHTDTFTDFHCTKNSDSQTSVYTCVQSQIMWMKIKRNREYSLRGDIGFGVLLYQLPLGIDGENPVQRNTHLLIGIHVLKSHTHKQSASPPKVRGINTIVTRLKYELLYCHRESACLCLLMCSSLTVALLPKAA